MISLCGIPLVISNRASLTAAESELLDVFAGEGSGRPFTLRLTDHSVSAAAGLMLRGSSTSLGWDGDALLLRNARFTARIDFHEHACILQRADEESSSLKTMLRVLATTELPRRGFLPIHGGAAVLDNRAILFVGRSGAGKSTLAKACPHPLLSDEFVRVDALRGTAAESGFWGDAICRPVAGSGCHPIRAIVSLDKKSVNALTRGNSSHAARALVASTLVPSGPFWPAALPLIDMLARSTQYYTLEWNKSHSPWSMLRQVLA